MGGCVSNHQKPPSAANKVQMLFASDDLKPSLINGDLPAKPISKSAPSFPDFGSKEETFFDSQAWLDSDCDDDFMSVNGEFTPSRGNTPVHHNFSAGNNKPPVVHASEYQASPNESEKKMRLSDLFNDSLRGSYDSEKEEDGEAVKNGGNVLKTKRERFGSCFPGLLTSRSSSTNGRKIMSPGLGVSPRPNPIVA